MVKLYLIKRESTLSRKIISIKKLAHKTEIIIRISGEPLYPNEQTAHIETNKI